MENSTNTNNIQIADMDCWAVDDWAAFGISLWQLQRQIQEDPAYISEGVDIIVELRKVVPRLSQAMARYAADVVDLVAGLCCECIRDLADSCCWDGQTIIQARPVTLTPDDNPDDELPEDLGLPPEWFDGVEDDDGDD